MKLVELEDTSWFPKILRDQQLGYIGWLVKALNLYRPIPELLTKQLQRYQQIKLLDLCSGSGEPMISIYKIMNLNIQMTLSDKYPPHNFQMSALKYRPGSTDVLEMNFNRETFYTMFNAFHHFTSTEQIAIVNRMKNSNSPFLFVELLEPTLVVAFKTLIANTIGQLLLAPFVKPFSWVRIFFTYIIPINLVTTSYDGTISVLKSKNANHYQTLLSSCANSGYIIQIEKCKAPLQNSLVIIQGYPMNLS